MKQTKFRPHWLLDNGDVIYADEVPIYARNQSYALYMNFDALYKELDNKVCEHRPTQFIDKKSDFTILCYDGSIIKAKWVGAENE